MMKSNIIAKAVLQMTAAQSKPSRDSFNAEALANLENWIEQDLARLVEENPKWQTVQHNREKFGR